VGQPTLGPNTGMSAHGARVPTATARLGGTAGQDASHPRPAEHSGTDNDKGTFGGDGTHRQRGWDGKDGEPGRRRGEKAANAAVGRRTRRWPQTVRRLRTGRCFGPGWRGGRVRRGAWSTSDNAAARLTERRRRRLRADTVRTAVRRLRCQTARHGHERRCGQNGGAVRTAAREARRGERLSGGGR
jgi:hypothetical protein